MNRKDRREGDTAPEKARLFDSSIIGTAQQVVNFITNILESSTEYSVIAKDLAGRIVLWNEGARRLYGYEPDEVVGRANSSILHAPQDVAAVQRLKQHKYGIQLDISCRRVTLTMPLRRVLAKPAVPFLVCRDQPVMFCVNSRCRGSNPLGR